MLLAFLAVSLCPLSLIAYRHSEVTRSALTRSAHQSLFAAASQTALRLDTFMAATANVVGTEAKMPALAEYLSRPAGVRAQAKADEVVDMLQAFAEKNSVFTSSVAVLDVHGRIVLDTQPSNIGLDESATRHFRGALETGLTEACRAGAKHLVAMWGHPDQDEGPRAFAERREPQWTEPEPGEERP